MTVERSKRRSFPFAVFNTKRPVLAFVYNTSISSKFLIRSATVINLCLSPVMFYIFFYANCPVSRQCLNQRGEKSAQKRGDVVNTGCRLSKFC